MRAQVLPSASNHGEKFGTRIGIMLVDLLSTPSRLQRRRTEAPIGAQPALFTPRSKTESTRRRGTHHSRDDTAQAGLMTTWEAGPNVSEST